MTNLYENHIIRKMPLRLPGMEERKMLAKDFNDHIPATRQCQCEGSCAKQENPKQSINCDQVAWITDALERFLRVNKLDFPGISRIRELSKTAFLLELMEILHLKLDDKNAAWNALCDKELKSYFDKRITTCTEKPNIKDLF